MSVIHDWRVILISLKFHPALLLNILKSYSTILILHEMTQIPSEICGPLHRCNSLSYSYVVQWWRFVMAFSISLRTFVVYRASPSQEGGCWDWIGWSIMFLQQLPVVFLFKPCLWPFHNSGFVLELCVSKQADPNNCMVAWQRDKLGWNRVGNSQDSFLCDLDLVEFLTGMNAQHCNRYIRTDT